MVKDQVNSRLAPLEWFYQDMEIPEFEVVIDVEIPQPQNSLLVNKKDMTSTLEEFHGDKIKIEVLQKQVRKDQLRREVILVTRNTNKVVEYGCIAIHLNQFIPEAQKLIMECEHPLGNILNQYQPEYKSDPSEFIKIKSDSRISRILEIGINNTLYGRCNTLTNPSGESLADVVEIIPPVNQGTTS